MILTNRYNLPDPVYRAIENDPYDSGDCDISTTRLINPPQVVTLTLRHGDKLEEDISERIWSLMGQCIHVVLERATKGKLKAEKRYSATVNGWKISVGIDLLIKHTLVDYKMTSVWSYIYKSRMAEWTAQGNVNRWIYHQNGGKVTALQNILFLRDWSRRDYTRSKTPGRYPPVQVVTVDLPLWSMEESERYIKERVSLHQAARLVGDADLPRCSNDERWVSDEGEPKRCIEYCPARRVCHQHREFLQKIDE